MPDSQFTSFIFDNNIWKLNVDATFGILCLEMRHAESRSTLFACINISTEKIICNNIKLKEPWWIGLEDSENGRLFLHHYEDARFAAHQGIICFDIFENKILWQHPNLIYAGCTREFVFALEKNNENKISVINAKSGEVGDIIDYNEGVLQIELFNKSKHANTRYPEAFIESNTVFLSMSEYLLQKFEVSIKHSIEFLEFMDMIFVSYYYVLPEGFKNYLLVVNVFDNVILHIQLHSGQEGIGKGSFFIFKNKLIYIKSGNELCIHEL